VNTTTIQDLSYTGVNDSEVKSSLTLLGKWDSEQIKLTCQRTSSIGFI